MNISYNWLKTILPLDLSAEIVSATLTDIGLEVEKTTNYTNVPGGLNGLIVGQVTSKEKHPNADRLSITQVNTGNEVHQIVCGAPNVNAGQKVIVALPGTTLCPINGDPFKIKKTKIRGASSYGMICAEDEIGLGNDHEGILVLDKNAEIGSPVKDLYNVEEDVIFEIGLTPNRADAMGHYGVARDLLAALKYRGDIAMKTSLIQNKKKINHAKSSEIEIEIKNKTACPRYAGVIIKNIKVNQSPSWLKNRLEAIGLNPINNVVDVTNYVLHELGQPLHAFDLDQIKGNKIVIQNLKEGTSFTTLDEEKRSLNKEDLMICNEKEGMCIAGVFGGLKSGVTEKTKAVFIESAYFNPFSIRKSAKRHGLNTDASFRFERGVDPNMVLPALQRAVDLIIQVAGGKIASPVYDQYPSPIKDFTFNVSPNKINQLCGLNLSNSKMIQILELLQINTLEQSSSSIKLQVPSYRVDVQREADIAEEILRIHGYNEVPVPDKLNSSLQHLYSNNVYRIKNKISNQLAFLGLNETLSNSLTKRDYVAGLKSETLKDKEHVELLNPLSSDTNVLRQSLLFNALEVIRYNQNNGKYNVHLFEFGKTYKKENKSYLEEDQLLIALSGLQNEEHWCNSKTSTSFYQLKGIVNQLISSFGLEQDVVYEPLKNDLYKDGLKVHIKNEHVGNIGWPSQNVIKLTELKNNVFVAEIFWLKLIKLSKSVNIKFKPIAKYPKVYRDLSLLINDDINFNTLKKLALKTDSSILKDVHLFDIYKGKNLGPGKKSYALRFELQDHSKTLKDKEIDSVMNKIQKKLISTFKAELR